MCFVSLLELVPLRFIWLWTHHRLGDGWSYAWQEVIRDGNWGFFPPSANIFCRIFDILATALGIREHSHTFWKSQHALLVEYAVLSPACELRVQWMAALVTYTKQAPQTTDGLSAVLFSNAVKKKKNIRGRRAKVQPYYSCSHTFTVYLWSETDDLFRVPWVVLCSRCIIMHYYKTGWSTHLFFAVVHHCLMHAGRVLHCGPGSQQQR